MENKHIYNIGDFHIVYSLKENGLVKSVWYKGTHVHEGMRVETRDFNDNDLDMIKKANTNSLRENEEKQEFLNFNGEGRTVYSDVDAYEISDVLINRWSAVDFLSRGDRHMVVCRAEIYLDMYNEAIKNDLKMYSKK